MLNLQFERLLVNKKDVKTFTISNPGLLPITWRLANTATLPKEFVVFPQVGCTCACTHQDTAAHRPQQTLHTGAIATRWLHYSVCLRSLSSLLSAVVQVPQLPCNFLSVLSLPQSGELAARSDVVVTVEFSAIEKRLCEARLALEVLDVAELQGVAHSIPLPIKGEAYKIEIDVNFPQVGGVG